MGLVVFMPLLLSHKFDLHVHFHGPTDTCCSVVVLFVFGVILVIASFNSEVSIPG